MEEEEERPPTHPLRLLLPPHHGTPALYRLVSTLATAIFSVGVISSQARSGVFMLGDGDRTGDGDGEGYYPRKRTACRPPAAPRALMRTPG